MDSVAAVCWYKIAGSGHAGKLQPDIVPLLQLLKPVENEVVIV